MCISICYPPPPPEGSTILAVSENWIQHLAVSEDSEANEAYMKRVVNDMHHTDCHYYDYYLYYYYYYYYYYY